MADSTGFRKDISRAALSRMAQLDGVFPNWNLHQLPHQIQIRMTH